MYIMEFFLDSLSDVERMFEVYMKVNWIDKSLLLTNFSDSVLKPYNCKSLLTVHSRMLVFFQSNIEEITLILSQPFIRII